jgi:putative two-component system response regulator
MLAEAGHYNDTDTGVHIWRMSAYASAIARAAGGWSIERSKILELAAAMHDTGKIGIQDSILKKPGPLTKDEFDIIKTHTTIGHSILSITREKSQLFSMAADIAFYHHEKWNGKGYPNGLSGKNIPESARIAAIADVFDALTMRRSYKEPWTVEEAFDEIQSGRGEHFDPYLVDCFFSIKEEIIDIKNKWVDMESNYDWFGDTDYIAIL